MNLLTNCEETDVVLNRFLVKRLEACDLRFHEYHCQFAKPPQQGEEPKALAKICNKLGVTAVRLGSCIITKELVSDEKRVSDDWELILIGDKQLNCGNTHQRRALESFERQVLEKGLKSFDKTAIEKSPEGGIIWWIVSEQGVEKCGNGWEVHKGSKIDIDIDTDGNLCLEIDIHHRFYTPWTLEQWLQEYPDIKVEYVRNRYKGQKGEYTSWRLEDISEQSPQETIIERLGISLADYHRQLGATEREINNSRVVFVRLAHKSRDNSVPHLSQRLSPSLTMEMLAGIAESGEDREKIEDVFAYIRKTIDVRLVESQKTAIRILERVYHINKETQPLIMKGYVMMSKPQLLAFRGKKVNKVAEVRYQGCAKAGENKFGCLNLYNDRHQYPEEVRKCLIEIAKNTEVDVHIDSYRTQRDLPESELDQQMFWRAWADEGVKTVLVVMDWSPNERKNNLRVQALQAGIATQFMVPKPKADKYKALNVVLGLLCKAGWQPVTLESTEDREIAELIIGFDTGTNGELYYGTSAFAVMADGQSLGWELPDVQKGETFSGKAIWQTVSKLVIKFSQRCQRYPKKLLLMRDGLVQVGEFEQTIDELNKKDIAVDVIGVRKSGTGRMGRAVASDNGEVSYRDAVIGTVIFTPKEKSFSLVTSQPVNEKIGSVRPLKVVHEYGDTPLELLALQTYHLSQLHPASGFRSCRLPWVLHFADKSSKEFQKIGQISILANIDRQKLIAV